jgi:hypothetical protein
LNFSLCVLEDANAPESGEDCFKPLTLGDGSSTYTLPNKQEQGSTTVNLTVKLPDGLTCERCVLRWHYTVGMYNETLRFLLLNNTIPPPPGGTAILPEYIHYYGYYYQVIVQCLST